MDCLFCKIIAKEIPAKTVLETDQAIVFYDIAPKAKVHVLVVPKQHLVNFNDVTKDNKAIIGELGEVVQLVTKQLGIADTGYKVMVNNGRNGGQEVMHMHWHVLAQ